MAEEPKSPTKISVVRNKTFEPSANMRESQRAFDLDNKVRTICAELLLGMEQRMIDQKRDQRTMQMQMDQLMIKFNEIVHKMDREAKTKDMVVDLKQKFTNLEKNMAKDIREACDNSGVMEMKLNDVHIKISEVRKERSLLVMEIDKIRGQVKDYENLINEQRGVHDQELINFKKEVTQSLENTFKEVQLMSLDRRQLKAMVRNQNYHFTELQKESGILKNRLHLVEKTCGDVPRILDFMSETDTYLQNYLPNEIFSEIHNSLKESLKNAPTKTRLDQVEYSLNRSLEIAEKIKLIGSEEQENFRKDEFRPMKLDFDAYQLKTLYEDEERDKEETARREEQALALKKSDEQLFKERLYDRENMRKLIDRIDEQLGENFKKTVKEGIDTHPKMIKLVQFYEDEMGSVMSEGSNGEDPQRRTKNSSRRQKNKSQSDGFSEEDSDNYKDGSDSDSGDSSASGSSDSDSSDESSSEEESASGEEGASDKEIQVAKKGSKVKKVSVKKQGDDSDEQSGDSLSEAEDEVVKRKRKKIIMSDRGSDNAGEGSAGEEGSSQQSQKVVKTRSKSEKPKKKRKQVVELSESDAEDQANSQNGDEKSDKNSQESDVEIVIKKKKKAKKKRVVMVSASDSEQEANQEGQQNEDSQQGDEDDIVVKKSKKDKKDKKEKKEKKKHKKSKDKASVENLDEDSDNEKKKSKKSKKDKKDKKSKKEKKSKEKVKEESKGPIVGRATLVVHNNNVAKSPSKKSLEIGSQKGSKASLHSNNPRSKRLKQINDEIAETLQTMKKLASIQNKQQAQIDEMNRLKSKHTMLEMTKKKTMKEAGIDQSESGQSHSQIKSPDSSTHALDNLIEKQLRGGHESLTKSSRTKTRMTGETSVTGGGRAGGRGAINKEMMEAIQRQIAECAKQKDLDKVQQEATRTQVSVNVFKTQIKMFENRLMEKRQNEALLDSHSKLMEKTSRTFMKVDEALSEVQKTSRKGSQATDFDEKDGKATLYQVGTVKKNLAEQINRVDLLTDAKIGEIKGLMKQLANQVIQVNTRVDRLMLQQHKEDYDKIPTDLLALSKDEFTLRQDLAKMIQETMGAREQSQMELKRLRREHHANLKDISQMQIGLGQQSQKINNVLDRQGNNDKAMATMFKIVRLDYALDAQDELDKRGLYLMGLTGTKENVDAKLDHLQQTGFQKAEEMTGIQNGSTGSGGVVQVNNRNIASIQSGRPQNAQETALQSAQKTGGWNRSVKAGQLIPLEHKMRADQPNIARKAQIAAFDKNCLACASPDHNETAMKAFKMACLQYQPSNVQFENSEYKRDELIHAKELLLKCCLSNLKHLDLGNVEQSLKIEQLEDVWRQMQKVDKGDGDEIDAKAHPPFKGGKFRNQHLSLNNTFGDFGRQEQGFLAQDSIESSTNIRLNSVRSPQAVRHNFAQLDPLRISQPTNQNFTNPLTTRAGRMNGIDPLMTSSVEQVRRFYGGDLVSETLTSAGQNNKRHAMSTQRHQLLQQSIPNNNQHGQSYQERAAFDSVLSSEGGLHDYSIDGVNCIRQPAAQQFSVKQHARMQLLTQGSPLNQYSNMPQVYSTARKKNIRNAIRTQGGKKSTKIQLGGALKKPSYADSSIQRNQESTVFSSKQNANDNQTTTGQSINLKFNTGNSSLQQESSTIINLPAGGIETPQTDNIDQNSKMGLQAPLNLPNLGQDEDNGNRQEVLVQDKIKVKVTQLQHQVSTDQQSVDSNYEIGSPRLNESRDLEI